MYRNDHGSLILNFGVDGKFFNYCVLNRSDFVGWGGSSVYTLDLILLGV